jgi:hypothetical protein
MGSLWSGKRKTGSGRESGKRKREAGSAHSLRNLGTIIASFGDGHDRWFVIRQNSLVVPMEQEQTYDDGRARNLEQMLRVLAERIRLLDAEGRLLDEAGELMRLIGDVRSELFHYEVRVTYDTPEIAESRRIVREAQQDTEAKWQTREWSPEEDESPER